MPTEDQHINKPSLFSQAPPGTVILFFLKLMTTLSFAVLYSTLLLYLTQELHFRDTLATSLVATFLVFSYTLHLLGGAIGGRYLSYRGLFCFSMLFVIVGCFLLSLPSLQCFYWGLAAFLTGTGLNVTCINCMITQLFKPTDKRRETAFLWNYSAMNIGFFIAIGVAGIFQVHQAFQPLFLVSSIGNILALLIVFYYREKLADVNTDYSMKKNKLHSSLMGVLFMFFVFLVMRYLLIYANFSLAFILCLGVAMGIFVIITAIRQPSSKARRKLWAYFILGLASLVFLTLYQIIPIGLLLFVQRNVDRHFLAITIAPQWYQNINSVILIFGGPLLSSLFHSLRKRGYIINIPLQFSLALIFIGLGIAILPLGISLANLQGLIDSEWVVICYVLLTLGELCIIPVGYAMVGELSPVKLRGILMGIWLMLTGVASALSNIFSKQMLGSQNISNPLLTDSNFSTTFLKMSSVSITLGIVLLFLAPWIQRRLIQD